MPPHLHSGQPVNQKLGRTPPEATYLCRCRSCLPQHAIDPADPLKIYNGQYVTLHVLRQHTKDDNNRGLSAPDAWASPSDIQGLNEAKENRNLARDYFQISPSEQLVQIRQQLKVFAENQLKSTTLNFKTPPTYASRPLQDDDPIPLCDPAFHNDLTARLAFLERTQSQIYQFPSSRLEKTQDRLTLETINRELKVQLATVMALVKDEWERQRQLAMQHGPPVIDTERYIQSSVLNLDPNVLVYYVLIAVGNILCGLSLARCNFFCAAFAYLLSKNDSIPESTITNFPKDSRTIISRLELAPETLAHVSCSKCYYLYPFTPGSLHSVPEFCTNRFNDGHECGRRLRKLPRVKSAAESTAEPTAPTQMYLSQDLNHWIGWMYSRPDIERYLDRSHCLEQVPEGDTLWDIWDSPAIRNFKGPNGELFTGKNGTEGRLVFSLNMDGFNPYGNRFAGKTVSVGAIYMVCLNLPPALRYKMENIFLLGIIPGPHQPHHHEINYILQPFIDQLLILWDRGIYLTKTAHHPLGRLVRAALIPLVCDLPASRTMSGFAHFTATYFCTMCYTKSADMDNFDKASWTSRDRFIHERHAREWLAAGSEAERQKLYSNNGARWSELLRLPYWDAVAYTVVDSMHMFYLRILRRHCREIWGMSVAFEDGNGITFDPDINSTTEAQLESAHKIWESGDPGKMATLSKATLKYMCRNFGLEYGGGKKKLLKILLAHYSSVRGPGQQGGANDASSHLDADEPRTNPDLPDQFSSNSQASHSSSRTKTKKARSNLGDQTPTKDEIDILWKTASKSHIDKLKKDILAAIYQAKVGEYSGKLKVADLKTAIHEKRVDVGVLNAKGKVSHQHARKGTRANARKNGTRVLGQNVLSEVRTDMGRLTLPSWVSPAPSHPGEAKYGKFSADQWRTFCTINLPITLIRLWGGQDDGKEETLMLNNFMHLVSAVKLASARFITEERVKHYEEHMKRYLTTLKPIFPGTSITPYQHLSLHFGDVLLRFGPVHGWRCFPFERYNYLLQQIPTNMKFGEMEMTMFNRFIMSQHLRAIFEPESASSDIQALLPSFQKAFEDDIRGTNLQDALGFTETFEKEDEEIQWDKVDLVCLDSADKILLPTRDYPETTRVLLRPKIRRLGQVFTSGSDTDGHVVWNSNKQLWTCGRIRRIFSVRDGKSSRTFVIVDEYAKLSDEEEKHDHFRRFKIAGGRLFHSSFKRHAVLIPLDEILCHAATCSFEIANLKDIILCLPLDK